MKLKPLGDRVLVKRDDTEQKTAGGIFIPDTANQEKPQRGVVVAAGPGLLKDDGKRTPLGVKEGDKVLFGKYSGTEVKIDDEELMILNESDILAVIC